MDVGVDVDAGDVEDIADDADVDVFEGFDVANGSRSDALSATALRTFLNKGFSSSSSTSSWTEIEGGVVVADFGSDVDVAVIVVILTIDEKARRRATAASSTRHGKGSSSKVLRCLSQKGQEGGEG